MAAFAMIWELLGRGATKDIVAAIDSCPSPETKMIRPKCSAAWG